jgi:hypothetical protein
VFESKKRSKRHVSKTAPASEEQSERGTYAWEVRCQQSDTHSGTMMFFFFFLAACPATT